MSLLLAALLANAVSAQGHQPTVPLGFDRGAPGNSTQVIGWQGGERIQVIYHPLVLAYPNQSVLSHVYTHLFLRAPYSMANTAASFDVTVTMASAGVPLPEQADTASFAANQGPLPQTTVLTGVNFPASQGSLPTVVDLPLQAPFAWQNGHPLLVQLDLRPLAGSWTVQMQDYPLTWWLASADVSGASCPATPSEQMFLQIGRVSPPQEWIEWLEYTSAAANLPALLMLGRSHRFFGGLPLPLGLPGAPGCLLQTSVESLQLGVTQLSVGGSLAQFQTDLPRHAWLAGLECFGQVAVLDAQANAAGLRLSQLGHVQLLVPPEPERTRYSQSFFGSAGPSDVIQSFVNNRTIVFDSTVL